MHQICIQDLYLSLHITYISTFKNFHKNTHLKVPGPRYCGIHRNPSTAEVGTAGWSTCDWPELHTCSTPARLDYYKNPTSKAERRTASVAVTSQSKRGPPIARLRMAATALRLLCRKPLWQPQKQKYPGGEHLPHKPEGLSSVPDPMYKRKERTNSRAVLCSTHAQCHVIPHTCTSWKHTWIIFILKMV